MPRRQKSVSCDTGSKRRRRASVRSAATALPRQGEARVIALYTELTTLRKADSENIVDYVIRAETAATALRAAEEVNWSRWCSNDYRVTLKHSAIVVQQEKQL